MFEVFLVEEVLCVPEKCYILPTSPLFKKNLTEFESERYQKNNMNATPNTPVTKTIFIYNKQINYAS